MNKKIEGRFQVSYKNDGRPGGSKLTLSSDSSGLVGQEFFSAPANRSRDLDKIILQTQKHASIIKSGEPHFITPLIVGGKFEDDDLIILFVNDTPAGKINTKQLLEGIDFWSKFVVSWQEAMSDGRDFHGLPARIEPIDKDTYYYRYITLELPSKKILRDKDDYQYVPPKKHPNPERYL